MGKEEERKKNAGLFHMPSIFIQHLFPGSLGLLRVQRRAGETRLLHLEFTDLDPTRPTHLISFIALYSFPYSSIKYNFLLPYLQIFAGALNAAPIPFLTVPLFFPNISYLHSHVSLFVDHLPV